MSGDFIVGFPGERDGDFEKTLELVREVGFACGLLVQVLSPPRHPGLAPCLARWTKRSRPSAWIASTPCWTSSRQPSTPPQVGKVMPVLFEKKGRNPGQIVGRSPICKRCTPSGRIDLIGQIVSVRIESSAKMSLGGVLETQSIPEPA